ncbi:MAG: hypothetical protein P4M13_03995 [Alphaproteobacteria bacterium]|nr:hypothetical protein [Alphaproteobacteria bacterium]
MIRKDTNSLYNPVSRWRAAAEALLSWCGEAVSTVQKTRGSAGEAAGAGEAVAKILWRKASQSKLLATLREAAAAMLMWVEHWVPSEPHQELIPWVGLLRPVSARNWLWLYSWPEEEHLHP